MGTLNLKGLLGNLLIVFWRLFFGSLKFSRRNFSQPGSAIVVSLTGTFQRAQRVKGRWDIEISPDIMKSTMGSSYSPFEPWNIVLNLIGIPVKKKST